jgi:hypothetical protein
MTGNPARSFNTYSRFIRPEETAALLFHGSGRGEGPSPLAFLHDESQLVSKSHFRAATIG